MKSQRNTNFETQILNKMMDQIIEDRTDQFPGVTNLIFCITKAYWERLNGRPTENRQTKLFFTTGLAIERALIDNWKGEEQLAGEEEGIFYHIDGFDSESKSVVELKSTRISVRKSTGIKDIHGKIKYRDIEFEDYPQHWIKQIAAYCYITKTTKAKLAVLHVITPEILVWDIEFTPVELQSNWMLLQSRRSDLIKGLELKVPPTPFEYNMEWECKECTWRMFCEMKSK